MDELTIEDVKRWRRAMDSDGVWLSFDQYFELAGFAISLHERLAAAEAAGLLMPGEACIHKKGGRYVVVQRLLAYSEFAEGVWIAAGNYTSMTTDPIASGEHIVIYERGIDRSSFARPARLFDEPGRFARIALAPEVAR